MNWRSELGRAIEAVPPEQLADLIGELARQGVLAQSRLVSSCNHAPSESAGDNTGRPDTEE